jgi:S-adenosylmethionine:tRNA ribosyltransferase-isomerase
VPLPPYIAREDRTRDRERYQTVYARELGSVAAPTAGLHFTPEIISQLAERGIDTAEVTLHVGLGTFQPVRVDRVEQHQLHAEAYSISGASAGKINHALEDGRRVVAIAVVGVMLTNFHLPRSTLLMLVCAFGGKERVLGAYRHAVEEKYRFYSYGDCMLVE